MQAWIKIMLNCMFTILFTSMILGVCFYIFTTMPGLQIVANLVQGVLGGIGSSIGDGANLFGNIAGEVKASYGYGVPEMFMLSIWLCIYFLKQVPGYAAAITGITINSAYELSHSIEHAGYKMEKPKDKGKPKDGKHQ